MTSISYNEMIHYLKDEGGIIKNTFTGTAYRFNTELGFYEKRYPEISTVSWQMVEDYEFESLNKKYQSFKKIEGIKELFQKLETEPIKFYVKEHQVLDTEKVLYELSKNPYEDGTYLVNYVGKPELLQLKYVKVVVETSLIYGIWLPVTD